MENKEPTPEEFRAAIELWNAACQLVTALHDRAQKRPELLRPIARQLFFWPGFISHKRAFDSENTKLMEKIELGVRGPYSSKQWGISAPSTQLALRLYLLANTYAKQWRLPPLTEKNKWIWFRENLELRGERSSHRAREESGSRQARQGSGNEKHQRQCGGPA